MSFIDDDSIEGSILIGESPIYKKLEKKMSLKERIIEYIKNHPKTTKSEIFLNVSSSGTASSVITGLIKEGILIEHNWLEYKS